MALNRANHPCFNPASVREHARIHLPVAPQCNMQCNYCNREYDCPNENRPGVASASLSPGQAIAYLDRCVDHNPAISVTGIAGPGDAFAQPERTLDALRRVRAKHPDMLLCVATNGLNAAPYADDLKALDVSHITVTMNCIDPVIGAKIYSWIRDGKHVLRGVEGARQLFMRQCEAIRAFKAAGVTVKINCIIIPGVNDHHVEAVARFAAQAGVDLFNCMPMHPVADTPFEQHGTPTAKELGGIRKTVMQYLPQMTHCMRCRADAAGFLGKDDADMAAWLREAAQGPLEPGAERPFVAAASMEGLLVNRHLGDADSLYIFAESNGAYEFVESRPAPLSGGGRQRWLDLAGILNDCRAILVNSAGDSPVSVLEDEGVKVVMMEGLIEEGLHSVYQGTTLRSPLRRAHRCGSGCGGDGMGCG